jgi:hypothetical protein
MADYRIIPDPKGTAAFQAEVTYPNGGLRVVGGFETQEAAKAWIADLRAWNADPEVRG